MASVKYFVLGRKSVYVSDLPIPRAEPLDGLLALPLGDAVHDAGYPVIVCGYLDPPSRMSGSTLAHSAAENCLDRVYSRFMLYG